MLIFWLLACVPSETVQDTTQSCNGLEALCDRRVDQVAFAGTHNSMSSSEDGWMFPNQTSNFERQLDDGIRALNIDTHWWNEEAYLCHTYCDLGAMTLYEGFERIGQWMLANPQEVLIITLQSGLDAETTMGVLNGTVLSGMLYDHVVATPWPTLGELIASDQRVLLFSSHDGGELTGYMAQWTHWIDNPYSAQTVDDFSCAVDRGDLDTATLFNVNHFITNPVADITDAAVANAQAVLEEHVARCQEETGFFPNQVLVDFYSEGAVLNVVETLNIMD